MALDYGYAVEVQCSIGIDACEGCQARLMAPHGMFAGRVTLEDVDRFLLYWICDVPSAAADYSIAWVSS